jgi:SAM-dependent methyltransferase
VIGSPVLVTVAQAFHWFDAEAALAEFHRVLKPGGHVAAIWNLRGESPFMADYVAVLRRFSPEYSAIERGENVLERLRVQRRVEAPRDGGARLPRGVARRYSPSRKRRSIPA